jgi:hypothetical protein
MKVDHVELLVEEPSMEEALRLLLPSMLRGITFAIHQYPCKHDLLGRLADRLRGYAAWIPNTWRIVVIVDRDDDHCVTLKRRLEETAARAKLTTRSMVKGGRYTVVNRLAIEELEAWYFGDWEAVRAAYPRAAVNIPRKAPYRDSDAIAGGTWEAFERIMQMAGYFKTGIRKIEAARAVATAMDPARNRSRSFQALRRVLVEMKHGTARR